MASLMVKAKSRTTGPDGKATPPARPRGGPARRMGDVLGAVGGPAFRRFGFVQSSIVSRWKEIVGERYAALSAPDSIRFPPGKKQDGVLTITLSGAVAPMMQHVAPEIIERTNRFFGYPAVAKIVLRQGDVARSDQAPILRPKAAELSPEIGDSLRDIADPELKAVLTSFASALSGIDALPMLGKVK